MLGIHPENDQEYLGIAIERLAEPLPDEWKACITEDEQLFFMNMMTGETIPENPLDELFR